MKKKLYQNRICVKKSTIHGFGVFAEKNIRKGEKIEECYFILSICEDEPIVDYIFDVKGKNALIFGYGSLYNHSDEPNADYFFNVKKKIATFKAARSIKKGEEIFISYGDDWFSSREVKKKELHKSKDR